MQKTVFPSHVVEYLFNLKITSHGNYNYIVLKFIQLLQQILQQHLRAEECCADLKLHASHLLEDHALTKEDMYFQHTSAKSMIVVMEMEVLVDDLIQPF